MNTSAHTKKIHRKKSAPPRYSFQEKIALGIGIFILAILAIPLLAADFAASSAPTGLPAPNPLGNRGEIDTCNLGLPGACNSQDIFVAGPESILDTWIFSEAIPWWISYFLVLASGTAVLTIMIGGLMITIGADSDIRKKGVQTIIWSLLGLGIALFAFVIVSILENLPLPGSTAPEVGT